MTDNGQVPERKIVILGFADSRVQAPFDDPSWEIWGVNDVYAHVPRVDTVFEVHHLLNLGHRRNPQHEAFLRSGSKPVWMIDPSPDFPSARKLPVDEILKMFPRGYFTNSISYMIAMAVMDILGQASWQTRKHQVPGKIAIYGVDMAACVAPFTRVLTDDLRWVPASEVKVGDGLLAFDEMPGKDGKFRQWRRATVEQANEIMLPSYQMKMEDGTKIVASEDHKWLTAAENDRRWKLTSRLVTPQHRADRPSRIVKVVEPWDDDRSYEAGYLAAAFDAEGHLSQNAHEHCTTSSLVMGFAQKPNGMSEKVEKELTKRGFRFSKNKDSSSETMKYHLLGGRPEILRFLGQIRPTRLLAKFKPENLGRLSSLKDVAVVESEFIGDQSVIALKTDTGTFIAEGFASHNSSEYGAQRPSCEYFVGVADGLGIEVAIPENSDLCKATVLYGAGTTSPLRIKCQSREEHLRQAKIQLLGQQQQKQAEIQAIQSQIDQVRGQMAAFEYVKNVWTMPTDIPVGAEAPLKDRGEPMPGSPLDLAKLLEPTPVLEGALSDGKSDHS